MQGLIQLPAEDILQNSQTITSEHVDLHEEVESSMKGGKSPGIKNIPAELLKQAGDETTKALTVLCQESGNAKSGGSH